MFEREEKRTRTEAPFTTIRTVAKLEPGTSVRFFLGGTIRTGEISRRDGTGSLSKVSYRVLTKPFGQAVVVPAANVMTWGAE